MRENGGLNFYRNLMKHEVTVDRNKTAPRCRNCCYFHPDFKYRRCLYSICPYGKPEKGTYTPERRKAMSEHMKQVKREKKWPNP